MSHESALRVLDEHPGAGWFCDVETGREYDPSQRCYHDTSYYARENGKVYFVDNFGRSVEVDPEIDHQLERRRHDAIWNGSRYT